MYEYMYISTEGMHIYSSLDIFINIQLSGSLKAQSRHIYIYIYIYIHIYMIIRIIESSIKTLGR
jgi:hypothetical protein